jgi:fructokinase
MPEKVHGRPVVFGKVLFDRFPDDTAVLGGTPFNVAWHLQGLGHDPLFLSRVGRDGPGRQVGQAMRHWGMDTTGLQTDADYPTGAVELAFEAGQPSFDILPDQAYDHFDGAAPRELLQQARWLKVKDEELHTLTGCLGHGTENLGIERGGGSH